MIPKIIHYCWMSKDPYPPKIQECIDSWHKYLPDYEFMLWNYNNFPRGKSRWVDEAYDSKKYAFCADYLRIYALSNYGGIYLDSDVTLIKSFNDLLPLPYFICYENSYAESYRIEAAIIGCEKGWDLMNAIEYRYRDRKFITSDSKCDMTVLPAIIFKAVLTLKTPKPICSPKDFDYGKDIINILPSDYFSPKDITTGEINITDNTYAIHNFSGSWISKEILDEWNGEVKKSLRKQFLNLIKKCILFRNDIIVLSNSPVILQFYLFWNLKATSPLVNTHISEEDFLKLVQILSNDGTFCIDFIKAYEAKQKPEDLYPITRIVGTDIEIHYPASESKQQIINQWNEFFKCKKQSHILTIFCSDNITNIDRFNALKVDGGITIGHSGDIKFDIKREIINWRDRGLMLRLGWFANQIRR